MALHGPRPKKFPWLVALVIAASVFALVAFLAIWQFLAPAERHVVVPYSDFIAEVRAGRVEEIKIRDREITFRSHGADGRTIVKETIGPVPDQALISSLRPDDVSKPLPKISFEK